mgnify:CR=1 FL=1
MNISLKTIGYPKNNEGKHFGSWSSIETDIVIMEQ